MSGQHITARHTHISIRTRATGSFRTTRPLYTQNTYTTQATQAQVQTGAHRQPDHITPSPPCFSIIICTYNHHHTILTTLASLRRQTFPAPNFEVIVIDNGSTDDTYTALQIYLQEDQTSPQLSPGRLQVQCLRKEHNSLSHARNTALSVASGDYIVFLDDDCIAQPYFLEQLNATYIEVNADAVGGSVGLHWEAARPHWLSDDLLDTLGLYQPLHNRSPMPTGIDFSSSCFSIRRSALQNIGGFTLSLSSRQDMLRSVEANDLCRRLRQAGYQLWYEPRALVLRRILPDYLQRNFLLERAYWQGRTEILTNYMYAEHNQSTTGNAPSGSFYGSTGFRMELREFLSILLIHRPLLHLAQKPMSERMYAAMAQIRCWGRIYQLLLLNNHVPFTTTEFPHILLVRAHPDDAQAMVEALIRSEAVTTTSIGQIPFRWLWQHRADPKSTGGIIHLYRPGAFQLCVSQYIMTLLKLHLARMFGISVVSTDAGGWWQNDAKGRRQDKEALHRQKRRLFEHCVFSSSRTIYTSVRHPEHLYARKSWQGRIRYLSYPGLRGTFPALEPPAGLSADEYAAFSKMRHAEACTRLGIPTTAGFVYLCFLYCHTENEALDLIKAFSCLDGTSAAAIHRMHTSPQLLLVGMPSDSGISQKILQQGAYNPAIHLFVHYHKEDLANYVAASDALVMPCTQTPKAGITDIAMLFYSYERVIIAPNLPQFYGLLPPYAMIQYESPDLIELKHALLTAPEGSYRHTEREAIALNRKHGWDIYIRSMLDNRKQ